MPPKLPSRARLRTLHRVRTLTTGVLLGATTVSLLSSAIACDPAPDPPLCSDHEPTAYASVQPDGNVELVVVIDQQPGYFNPAMFEPIRPDHVEGATIVGVTGYDYARFLLDPADEATTIRLRARLRCWPSPEENEEEDLPTYEILVELGDAPVPGDPLKVTITHL